VSRSACSRARSGAPATAASCALACTAASSVRTLGSAGALLRDGHLLAAGLQLRRELGTQLPELPLARSRVVWWAHSRGKGTDMCRCGDHLASALLLLAS
jgi:hypothetical protein